MKKEKIIQKLHEFAKTHPKQKILVETPQGTVSLLIGDAIIYEGMNGEIVIDSE